MKGTPLKLTIAAATISFVLTGCWDSTETTTTPATKAGKLGYSDSNGNLSSYTSPMLVNGSGKKLFAIYMVGSDLEDQNSSENTGDGAGSLDFAELVKGYKKLSDNEKDSLDIVVAFGGSKNWPGMRIVTIEQIVEDYDADQIMGNLNSSEYLYYAPEAHMGDESSLSLFLQYLKDGYDNHDFKFLDMWDHGSAYGQFGNDTNFNSDGLSLQETDIAFSKAKINFDSIGYDACLNANFELSSVISKYADYLIASEETEPGHGWDYEDVIQYYAKNSDFTEFAYQMIDNFVSNPDHDQPGKTLSLVDLTKYGSLSTAVDDLANAISNNLDDPTTKKLIFDMHNAYSTNTPVAGYGKSKNQPATSYDLTDLAVNLYDKTNNDLKNKAKAVLDVLDNYVIYANSDDTKPRAYGVTVAPMMDGGKLTKSQIPSESYWALIEKIYNEYDQTDNTAPTVSNEDANYEYDDGSYEDKRPRKLAGTRATFSDDNLKKVTTLYGNIIIEEDGSKHFSSVAELQSVKTENADEYFAPKWDAKWYILNYGTAEADNTPLFLEYYSTIIDKTSGSKYTLYSAEVDFVNSNKDYSNQAKAYDFARFDIKVDANNQVVSTSLNPYKVLYTSEEDEVGQTVFEKYGKPLQKGDKVRLLSHDYNLDTKESTWINEGSFIEITHAPSYTFETLDFDDDEGNPLEYYSMMMAEDLAGNIGATQPANAEK